MDNMGLQKSIEKKLGMDHINISYKKNPVASDGSFVYFEKKYGTKEKLVNSLLELPWIEKITFEAEYLNFWLKKSPLVLVDIYPEKLKIDKPLRLYQLKRRLKEEISCDLYHYEDHFLPLIKAYNLCVIELTQFEGVSKDSIKELIQTFRASDLGYMYRGASNEVLHGVLKILEACVTLIERTCDE